MIKALKHSWINSGIIQKNKLNHKTCIKCKCQKYYDIDFDQTVYVDRFGKLYFCAPNCVLPNTKL
jgi:hypothetical protein